MAHAGPASAPGSGPARERKHVGGLDLVRFFSAVMVMLFHLLYWVNISTQTTSRAAGGPLAVTPPESLRAGWVGVQIFFVLSGLVIAYSAEGAQPLRFTRGRMLRLLPSLWICAFFTYFIGCVSGLYDLASDLPTVLRSLVLFPIGPWIEPVYWTLSVEVSFYAAIAFMLLLGRNSADDLRGLALILAGACALFWLWAMAAGAYGVRGSFAYDRLASISMLRHGCYFALGIFLWLILVKADRRLLTYLGVGLCLVVGLVEIVGLNAVYNAISGKSHGALLPAAAWLVMVGAIVVSMRWQSSGTPTSGLLRILGLMTYPLYLIHNVAGATVMGFFRGFGDIVAILAGLGFSFLFAYLVTLANPVLSRQFGRAFDSLAHLWPRLQVR